MLGKLVGLWLRAERRREKRNEMGELRDGMYRCRWVVG